MKRGEQLRKKQILEEFDNILEEKKLSEIGAGREGSTNGD